MKYYLKQIRKVLNKFSKIRNRTTLFKKQFLKIQWKRKRNTQHPTRNTQHKQKFFRIYDKIYPLAAHMYRGVETSTAMYTTLLMFCIVRKIKKNMKSVNLHVLLPISSIFKAILLLNSRGKILNQRVMKETAR